MADRRLTPARPDLAASHLKGQVEAARFVDGWVYGIKKGRASLRAAPSDDATQVSELLYGESITVYEMESGWAWVQAARDHYVGYVRSDALGDTMAATLRVIAPMTPVFAAPDLKSPLQDMLPLNAEIPVMSRVADYVEIIPRGFVHNRHLAPLSQIAPDFVAVAEQFLGVPYVWGGKTFQGLDCSGLIQTALATAGISAPRDTDMMEQSLGETVLGAKLKRGDLVFWKGHVGVMRDGEILLHANAFHMQVASEPLSAAVERIGSPVATVKRL